MACYGLLWTVDNKWLITDVGWLVLIVAVMRSLSVLQEVFVPHVASIITQLTQKLMLVSKVSAVTYRRNNDVIIIGSLPLVRLLQLVQMR